MTAPFFSPIHRRIRLKRRQRVLGAISILIALAVLPLHRISNKQEPI